jgi:hypothetical protein
MTNLIILILALLTPETAFGAPAESGRAMLAGEYVRAT